MTRRHPIPNPDPANAPVFVGMASPSYRSIIDPHEDVGFLIVQPDRLEYHGETMEIVLKRDEVQGILFRPNAHTLAGLGRWIAIEGRVGGKLVRLLIEPRERPTLLANLAYGKKLKERLESWLKRKP